MKTILFVFLLLTFSVCGLVAGEVVSNIGLGAGQNYGRLGINASRVTFENFALVGGIGYSDVDRMGWSVGAQGHFPLGSDSVLALDYW